MPVHIRQSELASLESVRQPFVIDPEQMQNRRLEIVNVNSVADHVVPEFVRLAV